MIGAAENTMVNHREKNANPIVGGPSLEVQAALTG